MGPGHPRLRGFGYIRFNADLNRIYKLMWNLIVIRLYDFHFSAGFVERKGKVEREKLN